MTKVTSFCDFFEINGIRENTLEVLNKFGDVPNDVKEKVYSVKDIDILKQWFTLAIKSDSMASFLAQIN